MTVASLELWAPVTGYEAYYMVSNYGNVKSVGIRRGTHAKILKHTNLKGYSTKNGGIMKNEDGNYQENPDKTWSQAIPLPSYGIKKGCTACNKSFWKEENYRKHYQDVHTDGKKYRRTVTGLDEL